MATLVLSTVGTVLGGPVGSAIGALVGQSIDQQLLAPPRRGPRVGDLAVQTSSYGTQIPRVYGIMRIAGSVVWATDLVEHEKTAGAKGQPDASYSYTVSMAVALSSRRATSVKRIWADGKLLRGAAGDLKVGGSLRLCDGSEDQEIDPLIGSIEGIANTPAYRGVALAVFEDLELAEFGNRIPFLTFELEADEAVPSVGSILVDASGDLLALDTVNRVTGFAAYGQSIRNAIEPLVDAFGIQLFDDGEILRQPTEAVASNIGSGEFGNSSDGQAVPSFQREQISPSSAPAALRLTYYDAARDYQTGEARASAGEQSGREATQELAAVLDAGDAKSLAQQILSRAWARRETLTLRLPPSRLGLEPGTMLDLPASPSRWGVEKATTDGFVTIVELKPAGTDPVPVQADGGRIVSNSDMPAGPITVALFDVPNVLGPLSSTPTVLLAASSAMAGWKQRLVDIAFGGQQLAVETTRAKSLLGRSLSVLAGGNADLIDDENSVDIALIDADQWLTSCDDSALAAGSNLAVLGSELIQFGSATALGGGKFRLNHLLRGRGGTEWACSGHASDELFCLLDRARCRAVELPNWVVGSSVGASIAGSSAFIVLTGESLRPLSPVGLWAELQSNGDLLISWTRRSRLGFAWVDGVDVPLGEATELYRVVIAGALTAIELSASEQNLTVPSPRVSPLGVGPATIEVQQIGDFAASRPVQITITL